MLFDEARAFISNINEKEHEDWYVWKEDWPDWRLVSKVEGLTESIFRIMHVAPPPAPKGTDSRSVIGLKEITTIKTVNDALEIKEDLLEPSIRKLIEKNSAYASKDMAGPIFLDEGEFVIRGQKRYNKRYAITIFGSKKQEFKTHSRDISVGGVSLEDSVPDWAVGYFKVQITKPNSRHRIELMCSLVENQKSGHRFRLVILPLENAKDEKNLENWLAA